MLTQYRRLVGDAAGPMLEFLEAVVDEQVGRPSRAIARLEKLGDQLPESLREKAEVMLGRCYAELGDEGRALQAYRRASRLAPASAMPRLASARLLIGRRPDEAIAELGRGLAATPDNPDLLAAMAGAHLWKQAELPASRRSWAAFDQALKRAREATPGASSLVLMQADRLANDGHPEDALALLEKSAPRARSVAWTAWAEGRPSPAGPPGACGPWSGPRPRAAGDGATLRTARAS
ncbi:MAG: tetratricopeptide repeat protein [Singulisphaera sp.]